MDPATTARLSDFNIPVETNASPYSIVTGIIPQNNPFNYKLSKQIIKTRQNLPLANSVRFDELKKILESLGYEGRFKTRGSSHCTFRKPGCNPITIPRHDPIDIVYIRLVKNVLEREEDADE